MDRYDWEKERDRDRDRGREQGQGRDVNYERFGEFRRNDSDRERQFHPGDDRYREGGPNQGRYEERPWEQRGQQDWNRGRSWSGENRRYETPERRADYGNQGDWGRQGSWGNYGNRPDFNREDNRSEQQYAQGNQSGYQGSQSGSTGDWRGTGNYGGGTGSYGGGSGMGNQRGQHTGRGPKGWQRSDDRIKEDVNERLTDHPHIDASEIDVQVKGGEVTLTGTVDDRQAKRMAEDIAENVSGVKEVHNQLKVQANTGSTGQEHQQGSSKMAGSQSSTGGNRR